MFLTSAKNKGRFVLAGFACFCAAVHRNRRIQRIKRANDDTQKRTCCKTKQRYNLKNRLSRGKGKKIIILRGARLVLAARPPRPGPRAAAADALNSWRIHLRRLGPDASSMRAAADGNAERCGVLRERAGRRCGFIQIATGLTALAMTKRETDS